MSTWEHVALILGSVAAIALGAVDVMQHQHLTAAVDVALIAAGLSALGVKGVGILPS